jgi:hypothetical protein
LRWFVHIKRTDKHRIVKRLLKMKMSGSISRGKQCTLWINKVKRDIERRGWG